MTLHTLTGFALWAFQQDSIMVLDSHTTIGLDTVVIQTLKSVGCTVLGCINAFAISIFETDWCRLMALIDLAARSFHVRHSVLLTHASVCSSH